MELNVLVVEDNSINQQIALEMLRRPDIIIEIANNGKEAVEMIKNRSYQVVFMDVEMPVMDGYEATRMIRQDNHFSDLPIIAMTGHTTLEDREKCKEAGMDDYVCKPLESEQLFTVLSRVMERASISSQQSGEQHTNETAFSSSTSLDSPPIQLERIEKITGGKKVLIDKLLSLFLSDTKDRLALIESALLKKDSQVIRQEAHAIKGSSANLGAAGLREFAWCLEKTDALNTVSKLLSDLNSEYARIEKFCKEKNYGTRSRR